jgi:hypothetical protein
MQHIDPSQPVDRENWRRPGTAGANCDTHANSAGEKEKMSIRVVAPMFSRVDPRFFAV